MKVDLLSFNRIWQCVKSIRRSLLEVITLSIDNKLAAAHHVLNSLPDGGPWCCQSCAPQPVLVFCTGFVVGVWPSTLFLAHALGDVRPNAVVKDIEVRTALGYAHGLDTKILLALLGLDQLQR